MTIPKHEVLVSRSNVYCTGENHPRGERLIPYGERFYLSEDGDGVLCRSCWYREWDTEADEDHTLEAGEEEPR